MGIRKSSIKGMNMIKDSEILIKLENEHLDYQFKDFTNYKALAIGLRLIEVAKSRKYSITIDITLNRQQLFHYALEGTSKDNDEWIKRKNNVVYHFNKSSAYMESLLAQEGKTIDQMFLLNPEKYGAYGGSFPIIIKETGVVGAITISGLTDGGDHELLMSVLKEFI